MTTNITINDFEDICRTCMSRENILQPLYEKCNSSMILVDLLTSCTTVQFAEDDGLPAKICVNCINEVTQAFTFSKRCETTDIILRKCLKTPIIEQEIKIEDESEIMHNTVYEILCDYTEIKQEEDVKTELTSEMILPTVEKIVDDYELVEEVTQAENLSEAYDETYEPADESYEEDEDKDETYSDSLDSLLKDHSDVPAKKRVKQSKFLGNKKLTKSSEKPYICEVCSNPYATKTTLIRHLKKHTGERPHVCSICSKTFVYSFELIAHMRIHTAEKRHACSVCSKAFIQKTHLKNHMRIHTGEKPYICSFCNAGFADIGNLKRHVRRHTGEKPHICSICNSGFIQSNELKVHMRMHTGEKPYSCDLCSKSYPQKRSLKIHKLVHSKYDKNKTTV